MGEAAWRTEIDRDHCAAFGCSTLHAVFFRHADDSGGESPAVAVMIPEATRQQRRAAFREAERNRARVVFICDTRELAEDIAHRAATALSQHRRVPYEVAEAAKWGPLS
jgi:hypothetical protein